MAGKRVTFYLSPDLDDSLVLISKRMGVSKSILVNKLLEAPLSDLKTLVTMLPENPTGADILRFKGKSMAVVDERVRQMHEVLQDDSHD